MKNEEKVNLNQYSIGLYCQGRWRVGMDGIFIPLEKEVAISGSIEGAFRWVKKLVKMIEILDSQNLLDELKESLAQKYKKILDDSFIVPEGTVNVFVRPILEETKTC